MEKQKSDKTIAIVRYDENYLKRKFSDWTDADVTHERTLAAQDLEMLTAEANRRGLIKKAKGYLHSLDEFYEYVVGKTFIMSVWYRYHDEKEEIASRPRVGKISKIDTGTGEFEFETYDYDERANYTCTFPLPRWSSIHSAEKGNICFEKVSEHKGRDTITKFWEE